MSTLTRYNHTDFSTDELLALKVGRKIFVIFSTFGERESSLVLEKIAVLKTLPDPVIDRIIINHRRIGNTPDRTENGISSLYQDVEIMVANDIAVPDMGMEKGKGADMRRSLYRINSTYPEGSDPDNIIIVFLDADVLPEYFRPHFAAGLAGAVLKGADYAKAGFWREMGRVTKFAARPLFSAIDHPALKTLTQFSYPLSGECAGTLSFFNSVQFRQIYGVETGILIDAVTGNYSLADVNLGLYDHEHHNDLNIQKMSFGIIRTYLSSLIDLGIITLSENSSVSDIFRTEYISSSSERVCIEELIEEKKYRPLKEIL